LNTRGLTPHGESCECGPAGPLAPASRQEVSSSDTRTAPDRHDSADLTVIQPASEGVNPPIGRAVRPSKSPLYLSTARLLI
jgi:hypothetical protein